MFSFYFYSCPLHKTYGQRSRTFGAYGRWGYAPAYQKLPPESAEFAGMGPKSEKSLIGPPCPEAFII